MTTPPDRPYYTVTEAARRLRVSPSTIWRWINDQRLPAYRVGRRSIRIKKDDLETIIQPAKEVRPVNSDHDLAPRRVAASARDIWDGYDPRRVRAALAQSAGALATDTARILLEELRDSRGQDSAGRSA